MTTTKGKGDDKGPVEVEELVTRSELFIEQNSKKIIFGIIAVAVLVAAILGYKYGYATPQQKKAEAATDSMSKASMPSSTNMGAPMQAIWRRHTLAFATSNWVITKARWIC